MSELRAEIHSCLMTRETWALPVSELPPFAGLGGLGIDRGINSRTGELLEGDRWVQAVADLDPATRTDCETAHPAIAVALLHAHTSGVRIGPLGSSENLLIPIDLSVAASDNAPLAPVPGGADSDDAVVRALWAGGAETVAAAVADAEDVNADLEFLDAAALKMMGQETSDYSFNTVFDEPVHEVRSLCGTGTY